MNGSRYLRHSESLSSDELCLSVSMPCYFICIQVVWQPVWLAPVSQLLNMSCSSLFSTLIALDSILATEDCAFVSAHSSNLYMKAWLQVRVWLFENFILSQHL
jgi:hypothetical protein